MQDCCIYALERKRFLWQRLLINKRRSKYKLQNNLRNADLPSLHTFIEILNFRLIRYFR